MPTQQKILKLAIPLMIDLLTGPTKKSSKNLRYNSGPGVLVESRPYWPVCAGGLIRVAAKIQ